MWGGVIGEPRDRSQIAQLYTGAGLASTAAAALYRTMRTRSGKRYRRGGPVRRNVRPRYNYLRTVRRRTTVEGRGVTNQHDRQLIYRKKKLPYGKKKSWRRFKNKVLAVSEKGLGAQTVVFNGAVTLSNATSTNHGIGSVSLYGQTSLVAQHDDLNNMAGYVNDAGDYTNALGVIVKPNTKYFFQSAVLDITMRNISHFGDTGALNSAATLEVDVYEMSVKKVGNDSVTTFNEVATYFGRADTNTATIGNASGVGISSLSIYKRGTTPWDLPTALSQYGVKIWKKTKLFISNGQTATYQYRDPKRHVINHASMLETESCNRKFTRHIMFIFKVVPGIVVGDGIGETTEKLLIGCTRKYLYKVEGNNENRDIHISQ